MRRRADLTAVGDFAGRLSQLHVTRRLNTIGCLRSSRTFQTLLLRMFSHSIVHFHSNIYDGPWSSGTIRSRFSSRVTINSLKSTAIESIEREREHRKSGTPFQCALLRLNVSSASLPNVRLRTSTFALSSQCSTLIWDTENFRAANLSLETREQLRLSSNLSRDNMPAAFHASACSNAESMGPRRNILPLGVPKWTPDWQICRRSSRLVQFCSRLASRISIIRLLVYHLFFQ